MGNIDTESYGTILCSHNFKNYGRGEGELFLNLRILLELSSHVQRVKLLYSLSNRGYFSEQNLTWA